ALLLFRRAGSYRGEARSLRNLADLALLRADLDQAADCYQLALEAAQKLGLRRGTGFCLIGLGQIAHRRNQPDEARKQLRRAKQMFAEADDRAGVERCEALENVYFSAGAAESKHPDE